LPHPHAFTGRDTHVYPRSPVCGVHRCPRLRVARIEAIFVTHLHGDHLFGLPGLLCTMSATTTDPDRVVTVVGTEGIGRLVGP
jgi:ribonuclease BN (tRNA processing enzyme)